MKKIPAICKNCVHAKATVSAHDYVCSLKDLSVAHNYSCRKFQHRKETKMPKQKQKQKRRANRKKVTPDVTIHLLTGQPLKRISGQHSAEWTIGKWKPVLLSKMNIPGSGYCIARTYRTPGQSQPLYECTGSDVAAYWDKDIALEAAAAMNAVEHIRQLVIRKL